MRKYPSSPISFDFNVTLNTAESSIKIEMPRETTVLKEPQVLKVLKVFKEFKVAKELLVLKEPQVLKVLKEDKV